ncbi:MAG: AI-2E family transporter [Candidatus Spechtbacteria bacterium]|nr:AI-2E family transporter [Candidatus Spechtbacteria bacterium]
MPKEEKKVVKLDISIKMLVKIGAAALFVALFFRIWEIMASLFLGVVIAAAIEPTVEWLEKKKVPRIVSVPGIYFLSLSALFLGFYIFLPTLFNEIWLISQDLPDKYGKFLGSLFQTGALDNFGFLAPALDELFQNMQNRIAGLIPNIFGFISAIFGGVLSFILILVFSFYFSLRRRDLEKSLLAVTPEKYHEIAKTILRSVQKRTGRWLQAMFVLATFVGIAVFVILSLLNVEFALTVGILAGILELVPYIGPFIAGAIILASGATESLTVGIVAVSSYILLQQLEQALIVPAVMSRVVGFNPLFLIVIVLIGSNLAGLWGIILAVPLATAVAEIIRGINTSRKNAEVS